MKTYAITFVSSGTIYLEANSEEEARQLFETSQLDDAAEQLAHNGIDVTDVQEEM